MKRLLRVIVGLIGVGLIALLALELGTRASGYSKRYIYDPIYVPFPASDDIPFIHKAWVRNARGRGRSVVFTDSLGLRIPEGESGYTPQGTNELRIAVAGDSFTFGEGIPDARQIYCEILERRLQITMGQAKTVRVFNFGVSAYSVKQMAAVLEHRMLETDPDIVLMAIAPGDFDLNRAGAVDQYGYTIDYRMSGYVDKNSRLKRLLRRVHLTYLLRDVLHALRGRRQEKIDAIEEGIIPPSYEYVQRFANIAASNACPYAVIILPVREDRFAGNLKAMLERDGIEFVDLSRIAHEFSDKDLFAGRFDRHYSVAVHARIADGLAKYITKRKL